MTFLQNKSQTDKENIHVEQKRIEFAPQSVKTY